MKVIGQVGIGNYLVQASAHEIEALADQKVTYADTSGGNYYGTLAVKVGTEFNVKEALAQVHRNAGRVEEVNRIKQALHGVIAGLEMTEPFLTEPKHPQGAEETK